MSDRIPSPHSLESMVDMAVQQMLTTPSPMDEDSPDRMLFSGIWNDAYPAILVRDPILPDSAKIQLLYLMQETRSNPYGANPLPSIEKTSRDLGKSPTTVVRDRAIIRMTRWASQCQRVRDAQGRMRGLVWMLHGEPASLAEATALDPGHMELLEQAAAGHFDRIARRVAQLVLAAIDHDIGSGRDPLEPVNQLEQRLQALQTLKSGTGRYFSGFYAEELNSNLETSGKENQQQTSNFESSNNRQHSNFETRSQPIDFKCTSKFETGEDSSSSNKKTTTTSERSRSGNTVAILTEPDHLSAETHIGDTRGNSVAKTASTTEKTKTDSNDSTTLQWPTSFDDNRKRLVQRMLQHHLPGLSNDQQEVINALSVKLEDKSDPIRNLGNYVTKLCKLAITGELCPVEPPSPPASRSPPDEKLRISDLRGEISSLQRLIKATQHSGSGGLQILEAQLAQRRDQLRDLEQPRH
ncbi:MAG: STY4528 family pathogenicity island replication protein [Candidatus Thiodiazotropha sp.]